ncbi:MAG: CocE/NonD family hydrolase, partial [Candidatus Dormiibacterota bacterium]
AATHDVLAERGVMVTMRDGVRLATDLYLPAASGGRAPGRYPALLERTPYSRQGLGSVATARFFARHGYAVALQDVRGRYDSEGEWYPFALEGPDGYDTVEWLGTRDWCDGQVGTIGLSYSGSDQHALATLAPPHLAAMFASEAMSNYHTGSMRQGGAAELRFLVYALWMAADAPQSLADPALRAAVQHESENVERWLRRTPMKPGVSILRNFPSIERWITDVVRHADYDDYWKQPGYNVEEHYDEHADVPIHLLSGWYDSYTRASTDNFVELRRRKRGPVRLIVGPWVHGGETMRQSWSGDADFGVDAPLDDYDGYRLRFFDAALKRLDTELLEEAPVRIFVMGGGSGRRLPSGRLDHGGRWRDEQEWPLQRARPTPHYLWADGSLRAEPPGAGPAATTYRYDPGAPVPTVGGNISAATAVMPAGGFDQRGRPELLGCDDDLPLNARHDVLTFQTAPLDRDTEVTGPMSVHLWVSSSAVDTDFTAKLIDVYPPSRDYPDGYALNIGDGIQRARYRDDRARATPMTPGAVYELEVVLYPTSNVFAAGHRIRLDVSSSNYPRFDLNPNTGEPLGVSGRSIAADNTIHHDAEHPSHLTLPLVG